MHDDNGEFAGGLAEVCFDEQQNSEPASHVRVLVSGDNGRYSAESYSTANKPIRFCGHGALAAAWFVFEQIETGAEVLEFANTDRQWRAHRFDPNSAQGPQPGNVLHINTVDCTDQGICISGLRYLRCDI